MTRNRYKVSKRQWAKWTEEGRRLFNDLYGVMRDQDLFSHPKAERRPREHWDTTRWNAAWMAADLVSR